MRINLIEQVLSIFGIDEPQTVLEKAKELIASIEENAPLAVVGMKKL